MSGHNKELDSIGLNMYEPCQELKPYVQCYWSISRPEELMETKPLKIIADGGMGVLFNYGGKITVSVNEIEFNVGRHGVITGPTLHATYLTLQKQVSALGIRFNPAGAYPFICGDMKIYTNKVLPFSMEGQLPWHSLQQSLAQLSEPVEKVAALDNFLVKHMHSSRLASANWLLGSIDTLCCHSGNIKIQELCVQLNISQKQFERRFKQAVGLMPKQISRIFRLEKSRIIMRSFDFESLTQVSQQCEYADQAHFIREFKALVQATPKQYVKEKKMSI